MRWVSSIVPPPFFTMLMSRRSTFLPLRLVPALTGSPSSAFLQSSATRRTQSTAIGASREECCDTTLLLREVEALLIRDSRSPRSMGVAMLVKISHALVAAVFIESEMTVGCTPLSISWRHLFSRAPASTVTEVVPSPAFMSWDFASSTSIFAAGLRTSIVFRIVAPSFVMVTSPFAEQTILSIPRGPRLVRIASATALAAYMLAVRTSSFLRSSLNVSCLKVVPLDIAAW
mmetsp:Transcript_38155/g.73181  ORF Transcript_38155/g.73181 Transcript_38155/m.73181 type:complete len:231 (-) Transcript_38155:89-781(-)